MALYHKYRPQTFQEILGQNHVKQTLTNQLKTGDFAHAYLFSGPRGIGKTTTARILAKSLNCSTKKGSEIEPDNSTQAAIEINNSNSIDVIEIDAASHTGVQNVREQIIENAQFQPTKLDYKVFIIDEVHMLSKSAFNALLKILEEPPEYVVFILATTEPHELPDTIISRCQRFDFTKIKHDKLLNYLQEITDKENVDISENILKRIVQKSDGCARDAISLLDQLIAAGGEDIDEEVASLVLPQTNKENALEFINIMIERDTKEALRKVNLLAEEGVNMVEFILNTIELLRFMMITKSGAKDNRAGVDLTQKAKQTLKEYTEHIRYQDIVQLIDLALDRKAEIKQAPIPQLPVELFVLQWCEDEQQSNNSQKQQNNNPKEAQTNAKQKKEITKESNSNKERGKKNKSQTQTQTEKNNHQTQKGKTDTSNNQTSKNPESDGNNTDKLNKSKVQNNWNQFISEVEKRSPSLVFILKMANIGAVSEDQVDLKVKFGFHKDKLNQNDNKKKIEEAMSEAVDKKITIKVSTQNQTDSQEVGDLAAALGGEVVN